MLKEKKEAFTCNLTTISVIVSTMPFILSCGFNPLNFLSLLFLSCFCIIVWRWWNSLMKIMVPELTLWWYTSCVQIFFFFYEITIGTCTVHRVHSVVQRRWQSFLFCLRFTFCRRLFESKTTKCSSNVRLETNETRFYATVSRKIKTKIDLDWN